MSARQRKWTALVVFVATVCLAACDMNGSRQDPVAVHLRVKNASGADFSSVSVRFPNADADFGPIAAGSASDYEEVSEAYRYGYIEVEADDELYRLQPIDYVGEVPLGDGYYTFELTLPDQRIGLTFTRD